MKSLFDLIYVKGIEVNGVLYNVGDRYSSVYGEKKIWQIIDIDHSSNTISYVNETESRNFILPISTWKTEAMVYKTKL